MEFPPGIHGMNAFQAMDHLLGFLDSRPAGSMLCAAALTIAEPLVDRYWHSIGDNFIDLIEERADLRKVVRCCCFDERVPREFLDPISLTMQAFEGE